MAKEKTRKEIDVQREMTNFSNYLKEYGLKITNQRLLVAEKIFRLNSHFSVDSLTEILYDRKDEISRATIYRIVSLLLESGQLTEHNFGKNVKYYEHIPALKHHDHIVCLDCGHIEEFVDEYIEKVQLDIAEKHGFSISEHSLILYGRCRELKKTGSCTKTKKNKN